MRKIPQLKIDIRNESDDVAVIDIDGEIGWVNENGDWNTATRIKDRLKDISKIEAKKILVNINSLGGFVDDGLAIHDVLASHEAEIETRVIGMTASAATIIAQAGDKRTMSENSLYLIHKAWGLAMGNTNEMRAAIGDLEAIDKRLLNIYAKRSGKDESEFLSLMEENNGTGKWIDAEEAREFGLIDEAFEPMKAAASVDLIDFRNMGLPEPTGFDFIDVTEKSDNREKAVVIKVDGKEFLNELDERIKGFKENDSEESGVVSNGISIYEARERETATLI